MKRGVEILVMWLVIAFCANLLAAGMPISGFQFWVYYFTVFSAPLGACCFAGHAGRGFSPASIGLAWCMGSGADARIIV